MATLIAILGIITFAVLVIGLGVIAGGAIIVLLLKAIIPIAIGFTVTKIVLEFLKRLGGRH